MGKKDKKGPLPAPPQGAAAPAEAFDMVFHCQLAHGSPTKQVKDFTNVKQLYESIAKAFGIPTESVSRDTIFAPLGGGQPFLVTDTPSSAQLLLYFSAVRPQGLACGIRGGGIFAESRSSHSCFGRRSCTAH